TRRALARGGSVLEVGIGTGLNLPLYSPSCRLTGIDLSGEMLDKAVERVQNLAMPNVTLKVMDATSMDFGDNEFDKAVATYTISAVADPVAGLREMRRVVKAGGDTRDPQPFSQRAARHRLARGHDGAGVHAAGLEVQPRAEAAARAGRTHTRGDPSGEHVQRVAPREVRQPEVAGRLAALGLA